MNRINPKSLLRSKWTKVEIKNKEKHFMVVEVLFDEEQRVTSCIIEALISGNQYAIDWRSLKQPNSWRLGWK